MNKQDYEKYYQKGGSYIMPAEIFNELLDDYECFKNDCKKYKEIIDKAKEIIMQPNIEIREYHSCDMDYVYVNEQLLDILKEVEDANITN